MSQEWLNSCSRARVERSKRCKSTTLMVLVLFRACTEDEGDGVPFEEKMKTLSGELKQLFEESKKQEE